MYYNKELDDGDHKKIRTHINKKRFNTSIKSGFDEKKYIDEIVKKLVHMKQWYDEHRKDFIYYENCDKDVDKLWDKYEKDYDSYEKIDKNMLDSVVRRASNNLWKLVILKGCWNERTLITKEDIEEGFELIKVCINSIKGVVLKQDTAKKRQHGILYLLKDDSKTRGNLYKEMSDKLDIKSPNTQVNEVNKLLNLQLVTEFRSGRFTMVGLSERGKVELSED